MLLMDRYVQKYFVYMIFQSIHEKKGLHIFLETNYYFPKHLHQGLINNTYLRWIHKILYFCRNKIRTRKKTQKVLLQKIIWKMMQENIITLNI